LKSSCIKLIVWPILLLMCSCTSIIRPGGPSVAWLDELDIQQAEHDWREWLAGSQCNLAVRDKPLTIGKKIFERGIAIREGGLRIRLDGGSTRFMASVGLGEGLEENCGPTDVRVLADGEVLWEAEAIVAGDSPREIDVDLTGKNELLLEVGGRVNANGWNYGHADLVNARLDVVGEEPVATPLIPDVGEIVEMSKTGRTLGMEYSKRFPLPLRVPENDTGINVLVDLAREVSFFAMWFVPEPLYERGLRVCGSQATLHSVLKPGSPCRVRIPVGGRWPFAWWPAPKFNVVLTTKGGHDTQGYLPEEIAALKEFVSTGGGLVIIGGRAPGGERGPEWSLNKLAATFGATFTAGADRFEGRDIPALELESAWEVTARGEQGRPVMAQRDFEKGRVVLFGSFALADWDVNSPDPARQDRLADSIKWSAAGSPPAGGEPRLPQPMGGGGGIFPEKEKVAGGVTVFYAENQYEHLLKTLDEDVPKVCEVLFNWLPSKKPDARMFLNMAAGGGGGWAVNCYYPREIGIISLSRGGFISIFGHEQAHTMGGPPNADGECAADWPQGNCFESHAGWFQGKVAQHFTGGRADRNSLFNFDKKGTAVDLADDAVFGGSGEQWQKIWYVWQKMEDRYGTTWYPRWRWVQYTRWQDEPGRRLTWEESIEDMSIAAGEDLFPFFGEIGTTLDRKRLKKIKFMGKTIELPVAPIHLGPAGPTRFEDIGDYTRPIKPDPQPVRAARPVIKAGPLDKERGIAEISIAAPFASHEIRFTKDGTDPGPESTLYAGTLEVGAGTLVRARCFCEGYEPGDTVEHRVELDADLLAAEAEKLWKAGKTLPAEFAARTPIDTQGPIPNDTGINVLVDQSHQTMFYVLWGLRNHIRGQGFRVCTSLASLDSVLVPGRRNRIRLAVGDKEPFAWCPAPEFNVVTTSQQDLKAPAYTTDECKALKEFVARGGGLLVFDGIPADAEQAENWSMNRLLDIFGARVTSVTDTHEGQNCATLEVDDDWEVLARGEKGGVIRAQRVFGKGRVAVWEREAPLHPDVREGSSLAPEERLAALKNTLLWLAEGKPPVGGSPHMPHNGGVGFFPELEKHMGGVVVYYAANLSQAAMRCIEEDIPAAARQILEWLPNEKFDEPYMMVMGAGSRGGWAIGARPRAAAVLAYSPDVILGTFAHEMVHTMGGPRNAEGKLAALSPHHNQGEAHAGWFQGKIAALFNQVEGIDLSKQPCRDCNSILALEKEKGARLDLAREFENGAGRNKWGYGNDWTKLWYIYQKLDDRYGPTWYPRWYWVRSTRWQDDPGHRETWDEMVEDMSIAVGEDLFPFFREIGTTLDKDRLEQIEFMGETVKLPVAPIHAEPAGNVCLDPIGDYTRPLRPRS